MEYNIIADSCCDVTEELQSRVKISTVPLTLTVGEQVLVDDSTLQMKQFMETMKHTKEKTTSGAPSPAAFCDKIQKDSVNFIVTLSANISASYQSAMTAKGIMDKEGAQTYVFNTMSACAGESLVALKLNDLIHLGLDTMEIVARVQAFIKDMKTYFVLEDLSNLIKSGRLSRISGRILTALNIRPIMGADDKGFIAQYSHGRGKKQVIERLLRLITDSKKKTRGERLVISHCNNPGFACDFSEKVRGMFEFDEIVINETRGTSSLYANDQGIIIAF
ncbi:MAG: DegV family protein [Lachnospiraceae bacterium]